MAAAPPFSRPFDLARAFPASPARPVTLARPPLDLQRVMRDAFVIIALLLLNMPGNAGAGVFFAILTVMVLYSPRAAFKALAICWLGLMVNTFFVPKSLVWTPARLALPLLAFVRFSIDMPRVGATLFASPTYLAFLAYVAVMAACSVTSGLFTQIALTKLANYWAVVSAILSGVTVLRRMRIDMTEWFVSLIAAATGIGLASIALGVDNNFKNLATEYRTNVFVGAFLHPNCHSVYASLFAVFLTTIILLGDYPRRRIALPMLLVWALFMYWSKARAAVLATTVGLLVLVALARPLRNRFGWRLRVNVRRSQIVALLLAALTLGGVVNLATGGSIFRGIVNFINKSSSDTDNSLDTEKMLASRAGLIELSWRNFRENPLTGIGFQVSTDPRFAANATLFTAPVEKGVIVSAVLEEGGILGATAFAAFLLVMIAEFMRNGNVSAVAMLAAFLASNMGEVTFFSPGGSGAFGWTMIGAAIILGDHCWRRDPPTVAAPRLPA
jgi:O-antigen ligase